MGFLGTMADVAHPDVMHVTTANSDVESTVSIEEGPDLDTEKALTSPREKLSFEDAAQKARLRKDQRLRRHRKKDMVSDLSTVSTEEGPDLDTDDYVTPEEFSTLKRAENNYSDGK